ncbi:hypothetical protein Tco_1435617, partial [Tanacetum coccineum]
HEHRSYDATSGRSMVANGMWEAAQAHAANPSQTRASNGSLPPGTMS